MAIQATVISERGVIYEAQYIRVDAVRARKTTMDVEVGVYMTAQQAADGVPPHRLDSFFDVAFDMDAELNLWQQAYAVVKGHWPDGLDV